MAMLTASHLIVDAKAGCNRRCISIVSLQHPEESLAPEIEHHCCHATVRLVAPSIPHAARFAKINNALAVSPCVPKSESNETPQSQPACARQRQFLDCAAPTAVFKQRAGTYARYNTSTPFSGSLGSSPRSGVSVWAFKYISTHLGS